MNVKAITIACVRQLIQHEDKRFIEFIVWHLGCLRDGVIDMEIHQDTLGNRCIVCNVCEMQTSLNENYEVNYD